MRAFRFAGFVSCMAGLLTLIGLCPRAFAIGDSEYSRPTLRGLNNVFVLVEEVDPEMEKDGLTASQIKTDVELKLRLAGIKVFSRAEAVKQKGSPYLYVRLSGFKDTIGRTTVYIFHLSFQFNQRVFLERDLSINADACTWALNHTGRSGRIGEIRDTIKNYADRFLNAYFSANPK